MSAVVQLLRDLIALPSVNPGLVPAGDARAGEARVADHLAAVARRARLDVERQPVQPGRANVLITLRPSGRVRQRVLLAPHMDTVGVVSDAQLRPVLRRGRVYGRGACDTKGSVAAMFTALAALAAAGRRPASTEITLAALIDEEVHQAGSRALVRAGWRADLAIVGEPTGCGVVTAHKGDLWLQLETRGKAAHGARPDLGRNAVHAMARVVELLETDYAARLRRRRHPLLGHGTVNVGSIQGGRQPNIVPDRCRIEIDRRITLGETPESVRAEVVAA